MARSTKRKAERDDKDKKEAPVTYTKATKDNPAGIEAVSEEYAMQLGSLVGYGGPGAAGCTVAGPAVWIATEGGIKPLPVANAPEDVEPCEGADTSEQETSQAAALVSGEDATGEEEETTEQPIEE